MCSDKGAAGRVPPAARGAACKRQACAQECATREELARAKAELRETRQRLQDLSERLTTIQEQERAHLARELHDETGQILSVLRMHLGDMLQGPANEGAQKCIALVQRAVEHTRRLALNLGPSVLEDLDLRDALEWLLQDQAGATGWATHLQADLAGARLRPGVEITCFRIAQEALTNAARHARASEVRLCLAFEARGLVLRVSDNGQGFDAGRQAGASEPGKHFGLVSMSERAQLAGGWLEVDSAPGRGARVQAVFPAAGARAGCSSGDPC